MLEEVLAEGLGQKSVPGQSSFISWLYPQALLQSFDEMSDLPAALIEQIETELDCI
jgi:adenine C2-methylase RlmN of 23S rRNA A2503 and tRNA A37